MAAFLDNEDESGDLYILLNVDRTASKEEIDAAYRKLAKIFHPDKHEDVNKKKHAEKVFHKIKQAHEILSDPIRRETYNQFGMKGLEVEGKELVVRQRSPAEIIAEVERYKQEMEEKRLQQMTNPRGTVTVKINATELFDRYDDYEEYRAIDLSSVFISGMSVSQAVECPLTPKLTTILAGNLESYNGRGTGSFTTMCRYQRNNTSWVEVTREVVKINKVFERYTLNSKDTSAIIGENGVNITPRIFKQVNKRCYCTASTSLAIISEDYRKGIGMAAFIPVIVYQLDKNIQGKMEVAIGHRSHLNTQIKYENEKHCASLTWQIGIPSSYIEGIYIRKFTADDAKVRISAKAGNFGALVEYGCEKKITMFSWLGATLAVGVPLGVKLKIKLIRGRQTFLFPVHLSEEIVPSAVVYGTFVPLLCYSVMKKFVVDPYLKRREEEKLEKEKEEAAENHAEKKKEAATTIELMKESVDRSIEQEEKKRGLVVLKALYGQLVSTNEGEVIEGRCIDVSIPLQALVKDSQIILQESRTKFAKREKMYRYFVFMMSQSEIAGFYDPCPGEEKSLYIRYKFRNKLHQVTLTDTQYIRIPLQKHLVTENTDDFGMTDR